VFDYTSLETASSRTLLQPILVFLLDGKRGQSRAGEG